jgi:hypothetical protein
MVHLVLWFLAFICMYHANCRCDDSMGLNGCTDAMLMPAVFIGCFRCPGVEKDPFGGLFRWYSIINTVTNNSSATASRLRVPFARHCSISSASFYRGNSFPPGKLCRPMVTGLCGAVLLLPFFFSIY